LGSINDSILTWIQKEGQILSYRQRDLAVRKRLALFAVEVANNMAGNQGMTHGLQTRF
jgi:hypothetical protein